MEDEWNHLEDEYYHVEDEYMYFGDESSTSRNFLSYTLVRFMSTPER